MESNQKPIANPLIVLREEFEDWAILFNPDKGTAFGLNPTGVYIWKFLDGEHSLDDLFQHLRRDQSGWIGPQERTSHWQNQT